MPKHPNDPDDDRRPVRAPLSPLNSRFVPDPGAIERAKAKLATLQVDPTERKATMERVFGKELADAMADLASDTHEARQRVATWRRETVERLANDGASLIEIAAAIGCGTSWASVLRERLRNQGRVP